MGLVQHQKKSYRIDSIMRYAKMLRCHNIHTKIDLKTGLHAIIAVNNIDLGPAIGGCRFYHYDSTAHAYKDVLRLSYMMTLKAAISDLAHGGAKAVIMAPKHVTDRATLFRHFGDFVHELNGRYITACDVGTSTEDMNIISQRTPYVIGATRKFDHHSDPAPHTAKGVYLGIKAAVYHKFKQQNLEGLHVALQGAGNVAYHLAKMLVDDGAKVTACDPKVEALQRLKDELNIDSVDINQIYDIDCDIFCPCAMGSVINNDTIDRIKACIIAGSANNQLAHRSQAMHLKAKNVTYAPDFIINSGGLINAAMIYDFQDPVMADNKIDTLYDTLLKLFEAAEQSPHSILSIAEQLANEKLKKARTDKDQLIEDILLT